MLKLIVEEGNVVVEEGKVNEFMFNSFFYICIQFFVTICVCVCVCVTVSIVVPLCTMATGESTSVCSLNAQAII